MMTRYSTPARVLTITLILFYASLSVLAGACQSAMLSSAGAHHKQTHQGGLHTVLCAFACQANLASGLAASAPEMLHVWLVFWTVALSCFAGHLLRQDGIRARAPPSLISAR